MSTLYHVQITDPHLRREIARATDTDIVPIKGFQTHPTIGTTGVIFMAYQLDSARLHKGQRDRLAGLLARKRHRGRFAVDLNEGYRLLDGYPIPANGCVLMDSAVFDPERKDAQKTV